MSVPHSSGSSPGPATMGHPALMDRLYRGQRHIYDLTRRYFLLGRDTLIARMDPRENERVLEIGCGTARNLVHLARRQPAARFFGIDASTEMLKSARYNLRRAGLTHQVRVAYGLAEELAPGVQFGLTEPFDAIFFSYSLSMIPRWQAAVDQALLHLKQGGSMWVVDFWDQADLPWWFARLLRAWLRTFHVRHRPELLDYFHELETAGRIDFRMEPLYARYAYVAELENRGSGLVF